MKKIFSLMLIFALCLSTVIFAEATNSGTCGIGVKYSYNTSSKTLTIGGTGRIDDDTKFNIDGSVVKLVIGNNVTSVGSNTFKGFTDLTTASLGTSIAKIGISAFEGCKSLKNISIPASVKGIEEYAFKGCTALSALKINNAAAYIDEYAFMNCTSLKTIDLGEKVYRIGSMAFHNTAFYKDSSNWKNNMLFSNSYTYLLKAKTVLSGSVKVPVVTKVIAKGSFNYCDKITSVSLPTGLKLVDDFVFRACEKLTTVNIPKTITGIGWSAFSGCVSLTKIIIPSSVRLISIDAFSGCKKLAKASISNESCVIYNSKNTLPAKTVIYGFENSTAQKYAKKFNRSFENLKSNCIGHESVSVKKATMSADGSYTVNCSICKTNKTTKIRKISRVYLSQSIFSYDGKIKTPSVIIKNSKGVALKYKTAYDVTYPAGRKNVGTYKITVKFKGNYSGEKTLIFKILPKGTNLTGLSAAKGGFTAKWEKQNVQAKGYQIEYATDKEFKNFTVVTVPDINQLYKTVTGLKSNTVYYVRVRTYLIGQITKYYSLWSATKTVTSK